MKIFNIASSLSIDKVFIWIVIPFGLAMVFLVPPFQSPDEPAHFYRSYHISDFNFLAKKVIDGAGDPLPVSLRNLVQSLYDEVPLSAEKKIHPQRILSHIYDPLQRDTMTFTHFSNTALTPPIAYLPQAIGMVIGKQLQASPLILLYLGRIFNLLTWVTLVFIAIKIIPVGKWLMFLLALMPMSLFIASSLSGDVMTNGLSFLIISLTLHFALDSNRCSVNVRQILCLIILFACFAMTKQAYYFFPFIFLLIQIDRLKNTTNYLVTFSILLLVFVAITGIWLYMVSSIYFPLMPGVDPINQIIYITNHPIKYALSIVNSIFAHGFYIRSFVGNLGWLDTPLPITIYFSFPIALFAATWFDGSRLSFTASQRITLVAIFLLSALLVITMIYLSWTPVGYDTVEGVLGRYFFPIAPFFFFIFLRVRNRKQPTNLTYLFPVYILTVLSVSLYTIVNRYY